MATDNDMLDNSANSDRLSNSNNVGVSVPEVPTTASTIDNSSLTVDIRDDNGAIDTVLFGGSDFFNPGSPVSDFGLQNDTNTSTFVRNDTSGFTQQPVVVTRSDGSVVVTGTYTGGGANVDFTRTYSLVEGLNALQVETEFTNKGSDVTLDYFDTFDPDQGVDQGNSFGTFNDVLTLDTGAGDAKVGQATESGGLTFLLGSTDPNVTVASGSPFGIFDGSTLNDFFASPFDGNGTFDDQGTHIGIQLDLDHGETESFEYFQAYGTTAGEAQEQFIEAAAPPLELRGTEGDDVLTGTNRRDLIFGLGGNDTLQGLGGRDQIFGGNGNDLIAAGEGNDTVEGNDGQDDIVGGNGNDSISGGNGNDRLLGEAGNDTINGEDGNDTVDGGEGDDTVAGGNGSDRVFGGSGNDSLAGGTGRDTLTGGFGNDTLDGGDGNDRLIGVDPVVAVRDGGFGAGELDNFTGGAGRDTFVLGDATRVYYDDGDPRTTGELDYALITDFNSTQDTIQLQGASKSYRLDFFTGSDGKINADLIFEAGAAAREELIGTLQNVSSELRLTAPAFTFV